MKAAIFHLYWLRESGCDAGTPLSADELPPGIQNRVLELACGEEGPFDVRLPFFDKRDERAQHSTLAQLPLEREGRLIRAMLSPGAAVRDTAATCALAHPLWMNGPKERDAHYFPTWQRVSQVLQRWLRDRVADAYFREFARLEDREACYPVIVYQAARLFFGRPRTEFTYDLRDFPWCEDTLASSWKLTGRGIQRVLTGLEQRLREAGQEQLARRYSPVWFEDVLVAVQRRPKAYADLLARESAVINAVIDLGTQPKVETVQRSSKILNRQLRKMHGLDLRELGCTVFEVATRALAQHPSGGQDDFLDGGTFEDADVVAAGSPDLRVRG